MKRIGLTAALCCICCLGHADDNAYAAGESDPFDLNMRCDGAIAVEGVVHDGGMIAADETWAAGSEHVVYGTLIVPAGVTLTIEPGAVVKFIGGGLYAAGTCVANGVTFTDIADGGALGDRALPMPSYVLKGNIETDDATRIRFAKNGDEFASAGDSGWFGIDIDESGCRLAREEERISFSSYWSDGSGVKVTLAKPDGAVETLVDEAGAAAGFASWSRPPDVGIYEFRHNRAARC